MKSPLVDVRPRGAAITDLDDLFGTSELGVAAAATAGRRKGRDLHVLASACRCPGPRLSTSADPRPTGVIDTTNVDGTDVSASVDGDSSGHDPRATADLFVSQQPR